MRNCAAAADDPEEEVLMSSVETTKTVSVDELQRVLSDALGPRYRVSSTGGSTVKVGRTGVIPSEVVVTRSDGKTVLKVRTTGLVVSRIVQATSINPRVRRALEQAYSEAA